MINTSELRIGNIVTGSQGKMTAKVVYIPGPVIVELPSGHEEIFNKEQLFPTLLNDTWVKTLGFKQNVPEIKGEWFRQNVIHRFKLVEIDGRGEYSFFCQGLRLKIVRHVHDLQNIYFALTGEEL